MILSFEELRSYFEFLQKVFLGLMYLFVRALGDFLVLFAPVLRQIARYLPIVKMQDFASLQKLIPNHRTINSKQLLRSSMPAHLLI